MLAAATHFVWPSGHMARAALATVTLALAAGTGRADDSATAKAPAGTSALLPENRPQYWFGVAVENIPPAFARQFKLRADQGVMVISVFAESPAAKAGIRADDLLIEINGKPLTSQDDLAKAANTPSAAKIGDYKATATLMQESRIVFLRAGDRMSASLTPELRPGDMLVSGANSQRFSPVGAGGVGARVPEARNIVFSNGINVAYGPGYQVDANSQANVTVLRQAVGTGQAIVLTQETDENGGVKITIRDGSKTYSVEAGKLDQVPANLQPLARQLMAQVQATSGLPVVAGGTAAPDATDARLKHLEQQNEELKRQLEDLKALLKSKLDGTAGTGGTTEK